jgi:hypothetical protein
MSDWDRDPPGAREDAALLRETERERLRALVTADVERAARLHTADFQLINPLGGALTKEQYLGGISSGQIRYLYWEPEAFAVRLCGAALRRRSGDPIPVTTRDCRAGPSHPAPALLAYRSLRAARDAVAGCLVACDRCRSRMMTARRCHCRTCQEVPDDDRP